MVLQELLKRIDLLTRENNLLLVHQRDQHQAINAGACAYPVLSV